MSEPRAPYKTITAADDLEPLATIGNLVEIIAQEKIQGDNTSETEQQLDDTLAAMIDQRIAKWFKENQRSGNGN